MGTRRRARECGLQLLFQLEGEKGQLVPHDLDEQVDGFLQNFEVPERAAPYAESVARGVYKHREEIDALISEHSPRWKLERMARTDRNALRIGVYELLHQPEVPTKTAIDEAIELGKRFGTESSAKFINGVLDAIAKARPRGDG